MDLPGLLSLAVPYGPVGLLVVYFVWRDEKRDKRECDREIRHEQMEEKRIQADRDLAVSMTVIAERMR